MNTRRKLLRRMIIWITMQLYEKFLNHYLEQYHQQLLLMSLVHDFILLSHNNFLLNSGQWPSKRF